MNTQTVYLNTPGMICALGPDQASVSEALFAESPKPLSRSDEYANVDGEAVELPLGQVLDTLPSSEALAIEDRSRNNQLLLAAVAQIENQIATVKDQFSLARIGVIIGTSTSGIAEAESAIAQQQTNGELPKSFDYGQQEIGSPAQFLARHLGLAGPAITVSTACSSGAKALASARRLIRMGACDAVICGGVDSLCKLTVNGFSSLDAVSRDICQPFSRNRNGINIGEAACVFVMSAEPGPVILSGVGESSDAHHISAPEPQGVGAAAAMRAALKDANISAADVGYINLHGTATEQNDRMESLAVAQVLGESCLCSSSKPLTGHTLGAAGALELGFCYLALMAQKLPVQWGDQQWDEELPRLNWVQAPQLAPASKLQVAMSNSFAFGGNNISAILSLA